MIRTEWKLGKRGVQEAIAGERYQVGIVDTEGRFVALSKGETPEEARQRANLISAAPELLHALNNMLEVYYKYANDNPSEDDVADHAKAVIAKALGVEGAQKS